MVGEECVGCEHGGMNGLLTRCCMSINELYKQV